MGSYFDSDEARWRPSARSPITGLKLFITRYDWLSVVPTSVRIEAVDGVRISMSTPAEQPPEIED